MQNDSHSEPIPLSDEPATASDTQDSQVPTAAPLPSVQNDPAPAEPALPSEMAAPREGEPETEPPADEADSQVQSGPFDFVQLEDLANRSQAARLSVADEERMCGLLRAALLAGKEPLAQATPVFAKIPWIVGVRAVENAWAAMKSSARSQLLRSLAEDESEASRRLRLSLARALFKLDPATGLKLLIAVCKELRDRETGAVAPKNAQIFNNVFIGKAKPWILQIDLSELKPAEADLIVQCAICSAFSQPTPPVPLLSLLRWAGEADLLSKLPDSTIAILPKGLSRMSFKWQSAIRKEVKNLPESILALLKPLRTRENAASEEASEDETQSQSPAENVQIVDAESASDVESNGSEPDSDSLVAPEHESVESADGGDFRGQRAEDEEDEEDEEQDDEEAVAEEPKPRKPRPVYEPRPQRTPQRDAREPREQREESGRRERPVYQGRQTFNLSETLRQIEAHVQSLRTELSTAQAKLRQREDDSRRERRTDKPVPLPGAPSNEELTRLNLQLEARITELQARVEEISKDAEDRAASLGAHTEGPAPDPDQQLRVLLGLKLQEDYADFLALENESLSAVVQQHYRTLLRHIFEVLKAENIHFQ
jgi:hypothetical protein